MNTQSREHMCTRKARYPNRREARAAIRRVLIRSGEKLMSYACPWCDAHHIGHRMPAEQLTAYRARLDATGIR